ncbi:MAG: chemotaxis protein CheW [Spirulina sp. SIO3F2]|nr:chemotaxis protein CheW [Spirulina sp. SIO3F2]
MQTTCWTEIGVRGDRTCPELQTVTHCQNCTVYSQAGRSLLERPVPKDYVQDWTTRLAQPHNREQDTRDTTVSVCLFRLGQEWLAIPANVVNQAGNPSTVHSLPHRRDRVLRGLVKVRGQLLLCVSLHELLGIALPETPPAQNISRLNGQRLLVMGPPQALWAFEVDELYGLYRCRTEQLRNAPALGSQILERFSQSILPWQHQTVSYLDSDRLLSALQQHLL